MKVNKIRKHSETFGNTTNDGFCDFFVRFKLMFETNTTNCDSLPSARLMTAKVVSVQNVMNTLPAALIRVHTVFRVVPSVHDPLHPRQLTARNRSALHPEL